MTKDAKLSILLVEDSGVMRKMEAKILKDLGHQNVLEAADGQEAVRVLEADAAVDLIISDWNMPGMSGLELLKWVRANGRHSATPFIMATAQAERSQAAAAGEAGVSAIVGKPFSPPELKAKIDEALAHAAGETVRPKSASAYRPVAAGDGRVRLKVAHIQITDHLVLGVHKHLSQSGGAPSQYALETVCLPSWNPVMDALESGEVDAAFILAPIAMDMFGGGTPIRLVLLAHKNGSILVRNRAGGEGTDKKSFYGGKDFYIPHRLSVHHMLAHMFLTGLGLTPGSQGSEGVNVCFEVVPPIKMPEFLGKNPQAAGFMVAEPLGTKAIASGIADLELLSSEMWADHPCCVVVMRQEFIAAHPEAVQEFTNNLVEAGLFIEDKPETAAEVGVGFLDPEGTLGLNKAVLKNVLTEPAGITTHDLLPVPADLERMQRYLHDQMGVGAPVDLARFLDLRFAKVACGQARPHSQRRRMERAGARDSKQMLEKEGKYLSFSLEGREFGIGILKVREIVGMLPITSLPNLPPQSKGIINLRGRIIPVSDMRLRLGLPEAEYHDRTCLIVVETPGEKGITQQAFAVDAVSEVINVQAEAIEPPPSFGGGVDTAFILGMAKTGQGGVKILLDVDRLAGGRRAAAF